VIPSGSMENTAAYRRSLDHEPHRLRCRRALHELARAVVAAIRIAKQVIIFKPPFAPDTPDYVKRVIGLPGDSIDIRDGSVWVNGTRLKESYTTGRTDPYDLHSPIKVPDNLLFCDGRQSRQFLRQPLLGLCAAQRHNRHAGDDILCRSMFLLTPGNPARFASAFLLTRMRWSIPAWCAGRDCFRTFLG